jgi:hypothetical protein
VVGQLCSFGTFYHYLRVKLQRRQLGRLVGSNIAV